MTVIIILQSSLIVTLLFSQLKYSNVMDCRNSILDLEEQQLNPKNMTQNSADKLINNIVGYSQSRGDLLGKYSLDYYLNYFDRSAIIAMGDHLHPHEDLTQEQFIRIFLLKIEHTEEETLYLALSLKKLFQSIIERTASNNTIQFSDFTNYLCEKISKEDLDLVIPSKRIAKERLSPNSHRIRDIDLEPPLILNKVAKEIPKICKDLPKKNKKLDEKKGVSKFYYSSIEKSIIAIGTLSSSIYFFDQNLKAKNEILPNECKQMQKDIGILSMAFSPKSNRIGALLTNSTMIFWQGGDSYSTQKVIPNKNYGDKIYYFQLSNQWVTVDKSTLNFWDIKEQLITDTIKCKDSVLITDVCEITHLRGLCVSLVTNKEEKILAFYHQGKIMAKINLGNAGCHTLHYNKLTQSLVPLGYHNTVSIYTVESTLFDIELKYILRGHRSIITCIDSLEQDSLMITGDDIGQIRIWQVTYMRCVQSVKITKWLCGIKLIGNKLFYSDSRINVMELDHFEVPKNEKIVAIYQFYDERQEAIWIITRKDARKIDFTKGKIKRIFVLCSDEQEITSAVQVGDGFVIGNSRGQMFHYDSDCNIRWQKTAHESQIRQLEYDAKNRLLFTLGSQGKVIAWPQRTIETEQQRKVIVFKSKQVNILSISNKSNILIIGNTQQSVVTIWDYEVLKLYEILDMQSQISSIFISEQVDLILIATQDLKLSIIKFMKNQHNLDLKLLESIDLLDYSLRNELDLRQSIVVGIKMINNEQANKKYVTLATNKGIVINFDITSMVQNNFNLAPMTAIKESVNILRNQREDFQNSLNQHGRKTKLSQLKLQTEQKTRKDNLIWIKKIFKECINCMQYIQMKGYFLGLVGEEYSKIINIETGSIQASLNINHPLPIKWNLTINHHSHLKKNVCEVLKIIDSILKNYGYQMLARQYKMINITSFMDKIKNCDFSLQDKNENIQLLSSEYEPQDIIGEKPVQPSLKSLQAYKRVKMIKKMSEQLMHVPQVMAHTNKQSQIEKQALRQLLAPPEQIKYSSSQKDQYITDFTNRLMNSLPSIDNKKNKHLRNEDNENSKTQFQNTTNRQNHQFRQTYLTRSVIFEKDKSIKWKEQLQEKGMKQILNNLNKKLKYYRLQTIKQNAL